MDEAYDPDVDYKKEHMAFLLSPEQRNFRGHPKTKPWELSDAEMLEQIHRMENCSNYVAYTFYANDLKMKYGKALRLRKEQEMANKILGVAPVTEMKSWFITIGFVKDVFTVGKGVKCVERFLTYDWVSKCKIVMEFYTEHGWRPHIMMRLETPSHIGKKKACASVLVETIFKSSGFRVCKILEAKNHIEVKPFQPYHEKYLSLDKQDGKLEYLIKDDEFRKNEGVPEFWEK